MKVFIYIIIIAFNGCSLKADFKILSKTDKKKEKSFYNNFESNSSIKDIHLQIATLKEYVTAAEYKNRLSLPEGLSAYVERGRMNKVIIRGIPSIKDAHRLKESRFPGAFIVEMGSPIVYELSTGTRTNIGIEEQGIDKDTYNPYVNERAVSSTRFSFGDMFKNMQKDMQNDSKGISSIDSNTTKELKDSGIINSQDMKDSAITISQDVNNATKYPDSYANSFLNTVKGGVKVHKYMTLEKKEELNKLNHMVTYILFPREPKNKKVKKRYKQVLDFMIEREVRTYINSNLSDKKLSKMNRFVILVKNHDKGINLENYNYKLSKFFLDYLDERYDEIFFDSEGPFFITTRDKLFQDNNDLNILYFNLENFDKSAIIESINIYKNRLKDVDKLKISWMDYLKFELLAFIVPANDNIKNIGKLISNGVSTSAHASEN